LNLAEFFKNPKRKGLLPCILLALAAGVILLLLPDGGGTPQTEAFSPTREYREALEVEVEDLISRMEGVDSCTVVLTLSYGFEYLYATNQHVNEHSGGKETEKTIVLATEDGGEMPILLREKQPVVCGAAVVCPGADASTCLRISSLLSALFGLEGNAISIQT
jgi:stage III sporulation protein AG